jgi:hypothetical protein
MAKEQLGRAERLAALRDKLSKTDLRTGGGGFFSPPAGRSIIRILPEVGKMSFFFQQVGTHQIPGTDNKKQFYCPNFTSEGDLDCPICDYVEELKRQGDKASKALADSLRVKRKFWMNVIDRDHESLGPQIYTPGVMVFQQVSSLISDPDYGDIFDIEKGIDIIIEKKGEKLDTEYQVKPRRDSTPLHVDKELVDEWLEKAHDLTPVEVDEDPENDKKLTKGHILFILPYERLEKEFESSADDSADEEEERPARKTSTVIRSSKPVISKTKRDDPDEDDPDEDDPDEVVEDADEVAKELSERTTNRTARRHLR